MSSMHVLDFGVCVNSQFLMMENFLAQVFERKSSDLLYDHHIFK